MPFRSGNSCFAGITHRRFIRNCSAALLASLLVPTAASALTFSSIKGGDLDGSTIYYAVKTSVSTDPSGGGKFLADAANGTTYHVFDVTAFQASDTSRGEAIQIKVQSDKTFTGDNIILVAYVGDDSTSQPAPIARVDGSDCDDTLCQRGSSRNSHWFGVKLTSESLKDGKTLYLYPKDICTDVYEENSLSLDGCSEDSTDGRRTVIPLTAGSGDSKTLRIRFKVLNATNDTAVPARDASSQEDGTLTLRFQVDAPELVCPSQDSLNNSYFPGDAEIKLNSGIFDIRTSGASALSSGRAPASGLIVLGDRNSTPSTASFSDNRSEIRKFVSIASETIVTGFANTTTSTDVPYNLTFMIQDKAGLVAPATSACVISGVRTSPVQGFLKKSNCFIATAAYRSADAAPVMLLREFRDRVLLRFGAGKAFVRWYYGWSPRAATWLIDHPEFRYPVIAALLPLQAIAWLCLNPLVALLGFALSMGGLLVLRSFSGRARKAGA